MAEIRAELIAEGEDLRMEVALVDYLTEYIAAKYEAGLIEGSTATNYTSSAKHICRCMDGLAIGDVTPDDIQDMQVRLLKEGLSSDTVGKDFRFLKQVMTYAVDMGHLPASPFNKSLRPPKRKRPIPNPLTEESRERLITSLANAPVSRLSIAIKLGLLEGLRRGEACGLRWEDIFFAEARAEIARAIGVAYNKTYVKGTKTDSGVRFVPLEVGLLEDLRSWLFSHAIEAGFGAQGYILGTGEDYYSPIMLTKEFSAYSKALDLKGVANRRVTFHDLRDTFATNLLDSGVSPRTVADLMGHSDPSLTLRVYAGTTQSGLDAASTAIGALASEGRRLRPAAVQSAPGAAEILQLRGHGTQKDGGGWGPPAWQPMARDGI